LGVTGKVRGEKEMDIVQSLSTFDLLLGGKKLTQTSNREKNRLRSLERRTRPVPAFLAG